MLCRAADSLFWMSRYIERAENRARLLDVNLQLRLEFDSHTYAELPGREWESVIASLDDREGFAVRHGENYSEENVTEFVVFDPENPHSVCSSLARARENARSVREQITAEMWEKINQLYLFVSGDEARETWRQSPHLFLRQVVEGAHRFIGTTDATLTHSEGWDFIQLGKMLERADCTSRILDVKYHLLLPSGEGVGGNVDSIQWLAVLRSCSAMDGYLKSHPGAVAPWKVADFLLLNDCFPRSIRFCVQRLDNAIHRVTGSAENRYIHEAERLAGKLCGELNYMNIGGIFDMGLHEFLDLTQRRLGEIADALWEVYFSGENLRAA